MILRRPPLAAPACVLLCVSLGAAAGAQGLPVATGYVSNVHAVAPPPAFVSLVEFTPGGDLVTFDGVDLVTIDPAGIQTPIFTPPAGSFGEVLRAEPGGASVLLCVSPSYALYRHDFGSGVTTVVANLPYLYDLDFDGAGDIVAALGEATFSMTTLELLDPATFARTVFAVIPGATGPIAPLAGGDVIYGTNDFALASQSILRFAAPDITSALSSGIPLTPGDATTLVGGLDGLTSFAVDADGDLYFSENDFVGGTSRIARIDTGGGGTTTFASAPPGFFLGRLDFELPGGPYDPLTGPGAARLGAVYSDFFSANLIAVIEPSDAGGRIFGDCDGNGTVAITDVLAAMRHDVGLLLLTGQARAQCDVNGNGEVSLYDALVIAQFLVGIGSPLGY